MTRNRFLTLVGALVVALLLLTYCGAERAEAVSGTRLVTQHPTVLAQSTPAGRTIHDMALDGDRLRLGFGDYNANTGPVAAAWVSIYSGTTGADVEIPSEETTTLRVHDGQVYAPWVDPRGSGTPGGYTVGATNVAQGVMVHTFDTLKRGTDIFTAGACYDVGACIFRNGALSLHETTTGSGFERFYWVREAGGKVYAQAYHKDWPTTGGVVIVDGNAKSDPHLFPMRAWDGTRWSSVNGRASVGAITRGKDIESFAGRLWTTNGKVTDGKRAASSGAPFRFSDLNVSGGHLYGIGYDGRVARTSGGAWETLPGAAVPAGETATSVVVAGGKVYAGTAETARVYESVL